MAQCTAADGGRRAWTLVVTLGLTETASYGVLYYAFTVFLSPMQAELGWSRSALTGAFSLSLLLSGVTGLLVGRWLDRHGPHALMTLGSCLAVALTLAWSQARNLVVFYLIWAAIGVVMAAVLYEPAFWVVARRFTRQRGRALTVLTFVAGFASVIFVPLAGALVLAQGWRAALVTLAIILAVVTIPAHALVLRERRDLTPQPPLPQGEGEPEPVLGGKSAGEVKGAGGSAALRSLAFWGIAAAFFLITLSTSALAVHLVPLLQGRGYSQTFATTTVGVYALMALPGRLIFTPLGDRIHRNWVVASIFFIHALGMLALLLAPGMVGIVGYVILSGAGFGAIMPARASLVADVYGAAHYGQINSVVAFVSLVARSIGPIGMSLIYEFAGGYPMALAGLVATALLAMAALLLADR
ncbi:MAG TPA: MFS transporter [Ktedonobacterales bacterium]|jgi:MFS family permease|nr:MFS transporter [Ktedonobacterales bacterium]